MFQHTAARRRLDTIRPDSGGRLKFQHTAARRRLGAQRRQKTHRRPVSTHSRPKAAGFDMLRLIAPLIVSTHSRPKAAGPAIKKHRLHRRGFNTQPPEGGWATGANSSLYWAAFQHTAARRRLDKKLSKNSADNPFQHTAARRRLGRLKSIYQKHRRFNTQPPEGGWNDMSVRSFRWDGFNTQPPEGGWPVDSFRRRRSRTFQHTAARRRLEPLLKALLHQVSQP